MIKKAFANLLVRKALIFTGVLAIALVVMGGAMANRYGEEETSFLRSLAETEKNESEALSVYVPAYSKDSVWDSVVPVSAQPDVTTFSLENWTPPAEVEYYGEQDRDPPKMALNPKPEVVEEAVQSGFLYSSKIPLSRELQEYTYERCQAQGLEYEMVLALMWRESRFTLDAVGYNSNGTRDNGVMQINDVNKAWLHRELGITDLMDPKQNIEAGTAILGKFTEKYGAHNALLAYQYGEQGMRNKLAQGVTTNKQIQLVYTKQADFERLLQSEIA